MSNLLENKICVVTGAGKGIGRAVAECFLDNGAKLALITRSQSDIDDIYERPGVNNDNMLAVCGDVSDQKTVKKFIHETVSKYGHIDVLVNNAGIRFRKKFEEISVEEFRNVFDVNVLSIFMLCQAVLPVMAKRNMGKIINMTSVAGVSGLPELSGYVTSKAAIIGLTKSLALEYARNNIQINALAPGFCKTSYFESFKKKSDLYAFTIERTPMHRWAESNEIAGACLFLASDLSSYVTGDVINVDGGWSAW